MEIKILNERGTASLVIKGNRFRYQITTDFLIGDQPEFIDAIDRNYAILDIKKIKTGHIIYICCKKKQVATIVEDVDALFQEHYVEKFT